MKKATRNIAFLLATTAGLMGLLPHSAGEQAPPPGAMLTLVKAGAAQLPILAGSVKEPVNELRLYLKEISGADASMVAQGGAVLTTLVYSGVGSFIILKVIDMVIGLRVSEEEEREGLDVSLHGERVE
jgi:ammonia channel protein AmtB